LTPFILDVTTFAAVPSAGRYLVGALGTRDVRTVFALYELQSCTTARWLAEIPVDGTVRAVPTPAFAPGSERPATSGIEMLGYVTAAGARFLRYDGYAVHQVNARLETNWGLTEKVFSIHEDRSDLAFP